MNLTDFIELLVDDSQKLEIYDCTSNKTVYKGCAYEIPFKYIYGEITSIEPVTNNVIVLNISL